MVKKLFILTSILSFFLFSLGCPKKQTIKESPSIRASEELSALAERERIAKLKTEQAEKIAKEKELAKAREEEVKKAAQKEFEKSLVSKKYPGIEGEVLESHLLKDIYFDFHIIH